MQHLQGHQQLQLGQVYMPQYEQPQQLNVLNAHQIAAIQQQQQLQAQLQHHQQLQLQQQQQQYQVVLQQQLGIQQQGVAIPQTIMQPQFMPLRGNVMANFAPNQPQFIVNNTNNGPFYRILPQ